MVFIDIVGGVKSLDSIVACNSKKKLPPKGQLFSI